MVEEPADNPYVRDPDTSFAPVDDLDAAAAREQVRRLREAIEYHDYRYYVANDPVIADRTYDTLFDRLAELEAAVQALRGYVGSVRAVNEDVEQRADLAVRKVSVLERELTARSEEAASDSTETDSTADGPLGRLREWR